jgi:hypothetical protein
LRSVIAADSDAHRDRTRLNRPWRPLLALVLALTLPAAVAGSGERRLVLRPEALRAALPLAVPLSDEVRGRLWLERLDGLRLQGNRIRCEVRLRGAALGYHPMQGGAAVTIGDLVAEMAGDLEWRFDAQRQMVTITPRLTRRTVKAGDRSIEDHLLQLLALVNERDLALPVDTLRLGLQAAGLPAPVLGEEVAAMQGEAGAIVMRLRPRHGSSTDARRGQTGKTPPPAIPGKGGRG